MTTEQINAELDALRTEASELLTLKSRSPEQIKRMTEITARLAELKELAARSQIEDTTSKTLSDALSGLDEWQRQVPDRNRPPHLFDGETQKSAVDHRHRFQAPGIGRPEFKARDLDDSVVKALRSDGYSDAVIEAHTTKAYEQATTRYIKSRGHELDDMTSKAMTTGGEGGVLVPMEWGELITHPPMGPALATQVMNVPATSLTVRHPRILSNDPKYPASPVTVQWEGETPSSLADQGSNVDTDNIDITCHQVMASGEFSLSLLEDNAYNLSGRIPGIYNDTLNVNMEQKLIFGTGSNQPYGFLEQVSSAYLIQTVTTTSVTAITYENMIDLMTKVWQAYRAEGVWLMNSKTWGLLSKLKDSSGKPIFQAGFGQSTATPGGGTTWSNGTFIGRPYLISEFVDDPADTKFSLFYGNWQQGIIRRNRVGATIKVLDQTSYKKGCLDYVLRARIGARLVRPQAIAGLYHDAP